VGSYLAAVVAVVLVVAPWAWAGRSVARAVGAPWPTEVRALAATVVALGGLIVTAELVGTVHLFRRVPFVLACVLLAGVTTALTARTPRTGAVQHRNPALDSTRTGGVEVWVALGVACVAAGQWSLGVWHAFRHGVVDVDSVSYHLPQAARFVQDHGTTALHHAGANAGTAYYPANSELLHAIGMLATRTDALTPLITFGSLLLGMLGAFCIGRRFGTGPTSVIAYSVLVLAPILASEIAGSGYNDFTAIGFFLAAIACALYAADATSAPAAFALTGLAAGLAIGTKFTLVAPIAGFTLTLWWLTRRRAADLLAYSGGVVVGGAYWYVRNLVHVGNPVPTLDLPGLPSPPMKLVDQLSPSVFDFLGKDHFWTHDAPSGLLRFFGVAWPLVLALAAASVVAWLLALRAKDAPSRPFLVGLTLTIAASALVYVVTPTTAGDANGVPFLFVFNLRYVLPAFIPAFVLLPALPALRRRQAVAALVGGALVVAALLSKPRVELRAVAVAALLAVLIAVARRLPLRTQWATAAALAVGVAAIGLPAVRSFERARYADASTPRARLFAWGRSVPPHARVAIVGLALQYPFVGPHFETRVDYLGEFRAEHEFTNFDTCASWRRALRSSKYDYVIAEPPNRRDLPPAAMWTRSLPGTKVVRTTRAGVVLDIRNVTAWPTC
jgi:hypothetical protein